MAPFPLLPLRRVTSPTDSLVESLCMHARTAQVEEYAYDGRTNSSPNLGLIENVGSGVRKNARLARGSFTYARMSQSLIISVLTQAEGEGGINFALRKSLGVFSKYIKI